MPSSTEEYLDCFRQGDYLTGLDWLTFVHEKYQSQDSKKGMDAETLLNLATYELINHGFSENDRVIAIILCAFQSIHFFQGELAYTGTMILDAMMQFFVFQEKNLLTFYQNQSINNVKQVIAWMKRDNKQLTSEQNSDELMLKYQQIEESVGKYQAQFIKIKQEISFVNETRILCQAYKDNLVDRLQRSNVNKILSFRVGTVNALNDMLRQYSVSSEALTKELNKFVTILRENGAEQWEEELYLSKIAPKSVPSPSSVYSFFPIKFLTGLVAFPTDTFYQRNNDDNPSLPTTTAEVNL